jgi:hypothetical protein
MVSFTAQKSVSTHTLLGRLQLTVRIPPCSGDDFSILQQIVRPPFSVPDQNTHLCSLPAKIKGIFLATRTHAFNLAKFVTIYKVFLLLQKKMNGGKERDLDSLIAGGLGGWWVFGERTAVCPLLVEDYAPDCATCRGNPLTR